MTDLAKLISIAEKARSLPQIFDALLTQDERNDKFAFESAFRPSVALSLLKELMAARKVIAALNDNTSDDQERDIDIAMQEYKSTTKTEAEGK